MKNKLSIKIKTCLISVYNKESILEFAQLLKAKDIQIISTGGTASSLRKHGVEVTLIEDLTNFPEMLDGRVKTLHPHIHGGLLAKRSNKSHMQTLENHEIQAIDMVVINLYPFLEKRKSCSAQEEIIEAMKDLRNVGVKILTLGQYLQPSKKHLPVIEFITPEQFLYLKEVGLSLGFEHVESSPLVRSSYHAEKHIK